MVPPPPPQSSSSPLLRDLLAADGFKNRRRGNKQPDHHNRANSSSSDPMASRAASMPLEHRRPGKPARSQSDTLARSRLRNGGAVVGSDDGSSSSRDGVAGEEKHRRAATARQRSSASMASYSEKGRNNNSGAAGGRKGAAAVPALDESALNALISLAAGPMKRFAADEGFRASLRAACASCLGDHRAALDLRVVAQTVERAAAREKEEDELDPRDLKRANAKLHEIASLDDADKSLAACAHVYMSAVSKLRKRDHSAAVHALEAFCHAPREARTELLPALWDRLFRPGFAHLRAWRDREATAASSGDARVKEVEKTFAHLLDEGTRVLACYYRDWLLGRTDAMALPDVPAPPSTVHRGTTALMRSSASTSYDVGSDVVFSSGSLSPAKVMNGSAVRVSSEIEEEEEEEEEAQRVKAAREEDVRFKVRNNGAFLHERDDSPSTPTLPAQGNTLPPKKLVQAIPDTSQVRDQLMINKESRRPSSTTYPLISDISAIELLTLEFCDGPLQSDADGYHFSVFATVPSDFLCPLTRQIFNRPVTIETGQTFERHAIVHWFDRGFRACPATGQELESLSIPDTNRVLRRLIDNWKSEHCEHLVSEGAGVAEKLTLAVIDRVLSSARDVAEQHDKARHLMAIGGVDFLLRKFQEGGDQQKVKAAEHLLACIRAEGSCRNYVAVKISISSVLQLLHNEEVPSARSTAVRLLTEFLCLRRREMFELPLRGLGTESVIKAMDELLEHLKSLVIEEQAPVAVLLLHFDAMVEQNSDNTYREAAAKVIADSLRCCLSDDNTALQTRKALLLLGGHFSFSGDLLAEDWMLTHAGFIDDSRATPVDSDAIVQDKETAGHEAWLGRVTVALLGGNGRKPFLEALSRCLGSPDEDLVAACLTTAGWLTRSLASVGDDTQLAAFSALVPRLKQCLAAARPARHRVLAVVSLHNFSTIPDCRELLLMLADGLRHHLAGLAEMTWTARQLSAELDARTDDAHRLPHAELGPVSAKPPPRACH